MPASRAVFFFRDFNLVEFSHKLHFVKADSCVVWEPKEFWMIGAKINHTKVAKNQRQIAKDSHFSIGVLARQRVLDFLFQMPALHTRRGFFGFEPIKTDWALLAFHSRFFAGSLVGRAISFSSLSRRIFNSFSADRSNSRSEASCNSRSDKRCSA